MCWKMRALIMILFLMDYVKKDTTFVLAWWRPRKPPTTVVNGGFKTNLTPEEPTTTFTPPATSTYKTATTMMLTSVEDSSIFASIENETVTDSAHSTQTSTTPTTNVAEVTLNSSTDGTRRIITSLTISSSTTETEPSTLSEVTTSSPLLDVHTKSAQLSVIAGSIGGIILVFLLTIGLVILFRKRKRRNARKDDTIHKTNIQCNPANDEHCAPSVDNVSASSKDSGFGKHDESMEAEMMNGEYKTLGLHFPVNNEPPDYAYNHIDGSLTAESTYSHIRNSKDALFDNTYSHMANVTHSKSLEPDDKEANYNHLGDTCSSKRKVKAEESRNETYNHAQMSHVRPTADQEDQEDDYSHINLSGLKAQVPNAEKHRVDAQEATRTNAEYAKAKNVTKIGKKQHGDAGNDSTATAEGENNSEGHIYFVLESNTDQHTKQAPHDYAVVSAPK